MERISFLLLPGFAMMSAVAAIAPLQANLGRPVAQHNAELRLAKAEVYLRQTRLSITEIADLVGFSNQSNFARTVRAVYGVSPRELRASA